MRSYLETAGFRVSEAVDGTAAVDQACSSKPDVVVLDLAMPKLNGFDAARKLNRSEDSPRSVYIVQRTRRSPRSSRRRHRSSRLEAGRRRRADRKHKEAAEAGRLSAEGLARRT